jgi:ribonuclease P protein component
VVDRAFRLREDFDVRRVRARGQAFASGPLVARLLPNTIEPEQNRYTVIAGKKCGKAVDRNRLKRLTREALRGYHPHLKPGHDIAIIVRGNRAEMPTLADAQAALERIFSRAGLFLRQPGVTIPKPGDPVTTGWRLPRRPEPAEEDS